MTGLIGGTVDAAELEAMASSMYQEDWYEIERAGDGGATVGLLDHGNRDADANTVWRADGAVGVVHGVVSNRDRLSLTWDELFDAFGDRPGELLERLEGPFVIAYLDTREGEVHLATDKAGSRPVYYATDGGFRFASELSPLLEFADDPQLDERGVSDLLMMGSVLGDRTLIEGASNLPPATHLTYADGDVSTERYWYPERAGLAPERYPAYWLDTYRTAMGDVATTASDLSLWLSGGVDSRVAAGVLDDIDYPFRALTYRTPDGRDGDPAEQVAEYLGAPHDHVGYDADLHVVDAIERVVDVTDAMTNWASVSCLPFVVGGLHDAADVVTKGGDFLGEDPWAAQLRESDSAVEAIYRHKRSLTAERVQDLLTPAVDPRRSIQEEVAASVDGPTERRTLDAVRRLYSYSRLRRNVVQRSQVGTRTVAHGPMLDAVVRMPARYRVGALPLTNGRGDVAPITPAVIRRLDADLAEIPNERTVNSASSEESPSASGVAARKPRREPAGSVRTYAEAYERDERLASFVDRLMVDARDRDVFDDGAVADLHREFVRGEAGRFLPVASITGLELWAQRNLDGRTTATPLAQL